MRFITIAIGLVLVLLKRAAYAEQSGNSTVTTIKIGVIWPKKPSETEEVTYEPVFGTDGFDANEDLLPTQAFVDYWNTRENHDPSVKFEIVYGAHNFEKGPALSETLRFVNKERVAFFVGDVLEHLAISQQLLLSKFNILQCSTRVGGEKSGYTQAYNFFNDPAQAPTFMTTRASFAQYGEAAASLLAHLQLNRVVVFYDTYRERCRVRIMSTRLNKHDLAKPITCFDPYFHAFRKRLTVSLRTPDVGL
ncbi:hypothetical protein HK102_000303 [Quaeritorhiza haematococci]|nr:hypothetical protein HK102_000303 [Quaeritorhiza haematococci]